MTDGQKLLADLGDAKLRVQVGSPYQKKKAERDIELVTDRIRAYESHLEERMDDGYAWIEANKNHPKWEEFEDVWINLLHEYEELCNVIPQQYESVQMDFRAAS